MQFFVRPEDNNLVCSHLRSILKSVDDIKIGKCISFIYLRSVMVDYKLCLFFSHLFLLH